MSALDLPVQGIPVYLEEGRRRTFAVAVGWPGWARCARDVEGALDALAGYRSRYAVVTDDAGFAVPDTPGFAIVERVPGNATTDFGAPGVVPDLDRSTTWPPAEVARQVALLEAAWARLDDVADGAPARLRKGPRGGGRDRDVIVAHVLDAEHAFRRKAGLRLPPPKDRAAHDQARRAFVDLLRRGAADDAPEPAWPPAYAVRRIAWHALDHAWEIEDRSS